jgi:hypothetical protein
VVSVAAKRPQRSVAAALRPVVRPKAERRCGYPADGHLSRCALGPNLVNTCESLCYPTIRPKNSADSRRRAWPKSPACRTNIERCLQRMSSVWAICALSVIKLALSTAGGAGCVTNRGFGVSKGKGLRRPNLPVMNRLRAKRNSKPGSKASSSSLIASRRFSAMNGSYSVVTRTARVRSIICFWARRHSLRSRASTKTGALAAMGMNGGSKSSTAASR